MHWVANPMTSAKANRDFFESRTDGKNGYGSAHYIVGLSGEVIQCIPCNEVAYHVGTDKKDPASGRLYTDWWRSVGNKMVPNWGTIGVELCHIDWEGHFGQATLDAASELVADLLREHNLTTSAVGTHNMVVGWKDCPRLWTREPELFYDWREDLKKWTKE